MYFWYFQLSKTRNHTSNEHALKQILVADLKAKLVTWFLSSKFRWKKKEAEALLAAATGNQKIKCILTIAYILTLSVQQTSWTQHRPIRFLGNLFYLSINSYEKLLPIQRAYSGTKQRPWHLPSTYILHR